MKSVHSVLFILAATLAACLFSGVFFWQFSNLLTPDTPIALLDTATPPIPSLPEIQFVPPGEITIVGDIMLARSVELWMVAQGADYPFTNMPTIQPSRIFSYSDIFSIF